MKIFLTILGYLKWHYGKAVISLSHIWGNFIFFIFQFFSIKLLFKNYFDAWKRMSEPYPSTFDLKKIIFVFLTNIIVRLVGIIMRTSLIIIGLICYLLTIILYPFVIILWLLLPPIVIYLISVGIILIIK
jgi:hypothetical protein